jgi:MFS family permease
MPLVADIAPVHLRGRYMATMGFSWWVGLALAPTVGTRLLATSPLAAMVPAAAASGLAAVAALVLHRRVDPEVDLTPRSAPP